MDAGAMPGAARGCWLWAMPAALYVTTLAVLLIGIGPTPIMAPWDVFILLDGAWRILSGQIPHTDFHNPIGSMTYFLIAGGMKFGDVSLNGIVYSNVIFLLAAASWGGLIFFSRLPPSYALLMTLFIATLSVATRPLGYHPSVTTYAMIYNRYAWVLLILVLVQLFVTDGRETKGKNRFDAVSVGLLLGVLFFCKISYFIVGVAALALALVLRPPLRVALFLTAACFALICIGAWLALGVNAADYIRDIQAAGQAQSLAHRLRTLVRALAHNFWQAPLAAALWYMLAKPRDWRGKEAWPETLRVTAVYLFILAAALFLTVGNAEERSDIPLFFAAGIILLHNVGRMSRPPLLMALQERDWKHLVPVAIVVVFFGNIVSKDIMSIGYSVAGRISSADQEAAPNRFAADPLSNFVIPPDAQWRTAYWLANEIPARINDGLSLLRRHTDSDARLLVLALTDPFSFALGLTPPKGVLAWWDLNYSFNERAHPAPEILFAEARSVMVPILREGDKGCCQPTVHVLLDLYGPYLNAHFFEVERSASWILMRRLP
jgi:hypothetical protein